MRAASGWNSREDYARFLRLQHAARRPIEAWLSDNADPALCPPQQCDLIAQDLTELGQGLPDASPGFDLPADHRHALGVAWVLAGSSLGNRSILKEVERIGAEAPDEAWPHAFLADDDMLTFWKGLRGRIERPADIEEVEAAARAATAVFDHFLAATQGKGSLA